MELKRNIKDHREGWTVPGSEAFYAADVAAHFADAPTEAGYVAGSVAIRFAYVVLTVTDLRAFVFAERLVGIVEPAGL